MYEMAASAHSIVTAFGGKEKETIMAVNTGGSFVSVYTSLL